MVDEARLLVRLEASANKLVSEMKRAQTETATRLKQIDDAFANSNRRVTDGLGRSAQAYRQNAAASGQMGSAIQNTAFQVGDFAVQVAAGTDATRAMAQQLPQLLGGFGVLGAVLGAAAAVALPLAGNFLFAAESLKEIDALSLEGVRGRLAELRGLQDQYTEAVALSGTVSEEATTRTLNALDTEYQAKLALFKLEAVTLEQRKRQLEQSLAEQRQIFDELREQARENAATFSDPDAGSADFTRTQNQARQLEMVQEMITANEDVFLEIKRQSAELELVNLSLSEAQGLISGAVGLADSLAGAFGDAAANAAAMAANTAAAGRAYDAVLAQTGQSSGPDSVRSKLMGGGAFAPRVTGAGLPAVRVSRGGGGRGGGGGGGGGGAAAADPRAYIQARLDAATKAAEAARLEADSILMGAEAAATQKARLDLLNEAKAKKLDLDAKSITTGITLREEIDRQSAAIGKLTTEAEHYRERAQFMNAVNEDLKNGFLDAIVEGKNLGGVLENVAKQLAKAALEAALFNSGPFARRSGGGLGGILGGGFLGKLFGGFRANGGPVQAGRAYVVGENQPELFVPQTAGTILPSVAKGGGGASTIQILLSPELVGNILSQARGQSIQVAQGMAGATQKAYPSLADGYAARGTV